MALVFKHMFYYDEWMEGFSGRATTALTGMVTAVVGLACADQVELINHIAELERLKNAAAAAQARLTVELRQVR